MSDRAAGIVTFALPDESRPFARTLAAGDWGDTPPTVVHTGVGDTSAGRGKLRAALADPGGISWVISTGYAGGLSPDVRVGDLVLGRNRSDPGLLNVARLVLENERPHVGTLLSLASALETAHGKRALHAETGALAVDMETDWIAAVCAEFGVPLLSLRVVSDDAAQDFPVPGRIMFDPARQRPRYVAMPLWLLAHPSRIGPFAAFVRGLTPARARLTRALQRLVPRLDPGLPSGPDSANSPLPPP